MDQGAATPLRRPAQPPDDFHPLIVEPVNLAEQAFEIQQMREHLVLVGKMPAALVERLLVQWGEGQAVDLTGFGKFDRRRQGVTGQAAGVGAGDARRKQRRIDVPEGQYAVTFKGANGTTQKANCKVVANSESNVCTTEIVPVTDADIETIVSGGKQ